MFQKTYKLISTLSLLRNVAYPSDLPLISSLLLKKRHFSLQNSPAHFETTTDAVDLEKEVKKDLRRWKYAILLSYNGFNYRGMQANRDLQTIEGVFFNALHKAGYLTDEELKSPLFHNRYSRASRTDKFVSAVRQVVSLTLRPDVSVNKINEHLPDDIRVMAIQRTTRSFKAQTWCDSRTYSYILPTYSFCHYLADPKCRRNYRIDIDTIWKVNDLLKQFVGSHLFHNYTVKRDMWDARSRRVIISFKCSEPYLMGLNYEVMDLQVTGQSFMLHQIRRMVGMVVAAMRGKMPAAFIQESFDVPEMPAPSAPANGLILETAHFNWYNKKFGETKEPLLWEEQEEQVQEFKKNHIVTHIVNNDLRDEIMDEFLDLDLKRHQFSQRQRDSDSDQERSSESAPQ